MMMSHMCREMHVTQLGARETMSLATLARWGMKLFGVG